jgi:ElaB/YqjD/DUF883 family membrane-anchored ribosome-binding protein
LPEREATEKAPGTLTDTLNEWEEGIRGVCEEANATVNETVEGMATIVTDSAHAIGGAVEDTSRAVGRAFDVSRHYRRHPWLTVGVALLLGLVVVRWVSRRDEG